MFLGDVKIKLLDSCLFKELFYVRFSEILIQEMRNKNVLSTLQVVLGLLCNRWRHETVVAALECP